MRSQPPPFKVISPVPATSAALSSTELTVTTPPVPEAPSSVLTTSSTVSVPFVVSPAFTVASPPAVVMPTEPFAAMPSSPSTVPIVSAPKLVYVRVPLMSAARVPTSFISFRLNVPVPMISSPVAVIVESVCSVTPALLMRTIPEPASSD